MRIDGYGSLADVKNEIGGSVIPLEAAVVAAGGAILSCTGAATDGWGECGGDPEDACDGSCARIDLIDIIVPERAWDRGGGKGGDGSDRRAPGGSSPRAIWLHYKESGPSRACRQAMASG